MGAPSARQLSDLTVVTFYTEGPPQAAALAEWDTDAWDLLCLVALGCSGVDFRAVFFVIVGCSRQDTRSPKQLRDCRNKAWHLLILLVTLT